MSQVYVPRPWGNLSTDFLLEHPRCILGAGMGSGKTAITLTAIDALYLAGVETKPTLVVAPLRVARSVWPEEAQKWDHFTNISVSKILGSVKQRCTGMLRDCSVYTTNYENLPWLVEAYGRHWPFGIVVADESTKLKGFRLNQGGQRARALGQIAHKYVKRWINLSGTLAPNGVKDLWGQMWFIDAGERLGRTHGAFTQRWFTKARSGWGWDPQPWAQDDIQKRIADVVLTVDPRDYMPIEQPIENNVYVDLPPAAWARYQEMEDEMFTQLEEYGVEALNAAARTNKCLQLANGAAYVDDAGTWKEVHQEKLEALESVVNEAGGESVFVSYFFVSDRDRIKKYFGKRARDLTTKQDEDDWNAGKIEILLAHPQSAGHGLNLQFGGRRLVDFGLTWNLEHDAQILERIGPVRQMQAGLDRNVMRTRIIARGTVDEMVLERLTTKRSVNDILHEAMKRR